MRQRLKPRLRNWGATLMVAAYAFGVLAPTVAFAHADHASIVHVLSESHGGMLILHFHEEQADHHDQAPPKPGSRPVHHCCGVISMPALAPLPATAILPPQAAKALPPLADARHAGCGGARLERPPNSTLTA